MLRLSTRTFVATLALAAAVGCTGTPPAGDGTGTTGGTASSGDDGPRDMLIYAAGSDLHNLIPVTSTSVDDRYVYSNTYLDGVQSSFDCKLEFKPGLFESWEWSEDKLTLTYKMRQDIKWADGKPVTAQDVAFAYELIADKTTASPRYGYTTDFADTHNPPKVIDDYTVEFSWKGPGDTLTRESTTASYHLPKHLLESVDRTALNTSPLALKPVPNGPWKLSEHKANEYYVLEPNEKFTGPAEMKPKLKRVMFRVVPEYQTRLLKLKKGEVDFMDGIKVKDADSLKKTNPNLNFVRRGYRFMDYVAWNLKDERFQDKNVRKAMAYAVDIDGMIGRLLKSEDGEVYGKQAVGTITPEICSTRADVQTIKQDAAKAKQLLAESGWSDTDGDGVMDKDGVKLEFTLITNRENERRMEAAQLIQADLKQIGVNMKLDFMEFNAMTDRAQKRDFEAMLGGWSAGLFVDPSAMWHSGPEFTFNYPSYSNPEVDALIDRGLAEPDPEKSAVIWKEMQEKIYEDQPYLFLWWRDEIVAVDKRFEDANVNILSPLHELHNWSVPADKVKYPI